MMRLHDGAGRRKYLTGSEREAFLRAAANDPRPDVRTFCETLVHTGCRLSEALQLTAERVDANAGVLVFECLKKRRKGIYRSVPVPQGLLDGLAAAHDLGALGDRRLWNWSRTTGWRRVLEVMAAAGIEGPHATPKGLRHGLAIAGIASGVPLNLIQRWLGHSRLEITSIYADAVGPEERQIAERLWRGNGPPQTSPCPQITFPANACWMPFPAGFPFCAQFMAFRT